MTTRWLPLALLGALLSLAPPSHAAARATRATPSPSFGVGTLNVLGSQFTRTPGGYADGMTRARIDARLIMRRHLYLVGMQEVQRDQLAQLRTSLPGYDFWPSTALGRPGVHLQIAFRRGTFALVDEGSITTPFRGLHRPVPWVLLRHRPTGRELYVVDLHNTAGPTGMYRRERYAATSKEVALVRGFLADRHGVILLGDANAGSGFFCRVVEDTGLHAAAGGYVSPAGCHPPADPGIDWIMGGGPFGFSGYRSDRDHEVARATDHPLVHAVVTVRPRPR